MKQNDKYRHRFSKMMIQLVDKKGLPTKNKKVIIVC